jgi:signal transduction histidine kinase
MKSGFDSMAAQREAGVPAPDDFAVVPAIMQATDTAFWIYGFETGRIVWANRRALDLWDADDLESLRARDLVREMSPSVRKRLAQHREDFALDPGREIREFWTLYPQGEPFRVRATLRRFDVAGGADAMLVEARPEDAQEPTTVRSADALLHTEVITALFDRTGAELYANPAFRSAFGPGRHHFGSDFVHAGDSRAFHDGMAEAGLFRATVQVRTTAGMRWHDIHAARCRDSITGDGAFLISATDVTAARDQQAELADALEAAQAADLSKSRFLATMSHEMRTPLNGVLGMASILGSSHLGAAQRRAVDVIAASGTAMLQMVEDMLDIVSLERGTALLHPAPYDPGLLLEAAGEGVREEAVRKGLTLQTDTRRLRGGVYVHDASRLRQVLRHLLGNAVKFTERGSVVLRGISTIGEDGSSRLRFEVADTGPGIPEDERERIFERFYQIDASATRRHGGTGLGLAICREHVALWGGSIGVSGGAAGGATFWFDTPAVLTSADRSAAHG